MPGGRPSGTPGNPRNRNRIVEAYLAIEPVRRLGMDRAALRERLMNEGVDWSQLFGALIQAYAESRGKPHAGEKTPRHALHVSTLCDWFPDCSIIHLVRDPRAAVCSLTQMPWASRSVLMGARTWCLFNVAAGAEAARDNYIRVHYEDLVARPEEQLRRLCNHIGLQYQEAMLQPDPAEFDPGRPVHRAYEKMTPARVALWRTELEPWQVSVIEAAAGNHMEDFGYERQTKGATTGMSRASLEAFVEMTFQKVFRSPSAFYHFLQPTNLADEDKWLRRAFAMYGRVRSLPKATVQRPSAPVP